MVKSSLKSTAKMKVKNEIGKSRVKVSKKNHISSLPVLSQQPLPISESASSSAFSPTITLSTSGIRFPKVYFAKCSFNFSCVANCTFLRRSVVQCFIC